MHLCSVHTCHTSQFVSDMNTKQESQHLQKDTLQKDTLQKDTLQKDTLQEENP